MITSVDWCRWALQPQTQVKKKNWQQAPLGLFLTLPPPSFPKITSVLTAPALVDLPIKFYVSGIIQRIHFWVWFFRSMLCLWNLPIFSVAIIVYSSSLLYGILLYEYAAMYLTILQLRDVGLFSVEGSGCYKQHCWEQPCSWLSVCTYGHFCGIDPRVELLGLGPTYALICMILSNHFAK